MIYCQGTWDNLALQCQNCANLHIMSLKMNGDHYYIYGKYPLTNKDEPCPRYIPIQEVENNDNA